MSRTIKFRGKRTDTGEWVYGDLFQKKDGLVAIRRNYHTWAEGPYDLPDPSDDEDYIVYPDTVGQYTGLKDKNGTAVWEGDLLLTPERDIMVVEWQDAKLITKCVRPANPRYVNSLAFAYPVSVIIGNIHDNPELLEDE